MKAVELSARMQALANMVSKGSVVCDVGCDHGWVSIYLIQQKIASRVFAMDVGAGPLKRAEEHIAEYHLETYIETRLSDGLEALEPGEADCMVCAGMGGPLMQKILTEGREKAGAMQELILQPQSEIAAFRMFLRREGYRIVQENMVFEDGKYYPMMKAVPLKELLEADRDISAETGKEKEAVEPEIRLLQDIYGPLLLRDKHPVLMQYLTFSMQQIQELLQHLREQKTERAQSRIQELEQELLLIEKAQKRMR